MNLIYLYHVKIQKLKEWCRRWLILKILNTQTGSELGRLGSITRNLGEL
nr:MAG TPA: hypothetical protein [Caudoviricetes sp.]DAT75397.1 MAG TPA: hypothetical protein [Caudoviricetes sp.]DAX60443.1 MAG TPA: hypothetical protein [Caudoviricetes sp.]